MANSVHIEDLGPSLRDLNWKLRQIGLAVKIDVYETGIVRGAFITEATPWHIKCDACANDYIVTTEAEPACPRCGTREY